MVEMRLGTYHERRTEGEAHFACLFTGDAMTVTATIAVTRN